MSTLLTKLRAPLAAVALCSMLVTLVAPVAWADSSADANSAGSDISITRASGVSTVTVSGQDISGTRDAVSCSAIPGGWVNPVSGTKWISSVADCTAVAVGDFTYTTTFTLPSDLSTLQNLRLDGQAMVDDSVTVQLNGHTLFTGGGAGGASNFSATDRTWFNAGTNTLTFQVHNSGGASALDFTATTTAHSDASNNYWLTRSSGNSTVTVSGPDFSGTRNAVSCSTIPSGWASPINGTKWISSVADCTAVAGGDFTYTTTFTLPSDLSTLQNLRLDGQAMVDDTVNVLLNGHTLLSGGNWNNANSFSTADQSWFAAGANTVTFQVHNGPGASGLDFNLTVTAHSVTPTVDNDRDHGRQHGDEDEDEDNGAHGACVSAVAHSAPHGRAHGEAVREAAHSCDGHGDDDD